MSESFASDSFASGLLYSFFFLIPRTRSAKKADGGGGRNMKKN
jgi:hypothetical protein